ncbi:hypothetical protein J2S57_002459 [Kineosporia succinea]|uniref:Uncharacterized protein n=1 Tax=Kineosporia succinea TaxID=84632 RepID=A0ABT9P3D8_9ACTN|nr:hypothetical protein [Kineosporia succinea]
MSRPIRTPEKLAEFPASTERVGSGELQKAS